MSSDHLRFSFLIAALILSLSLFLSLGIWQLERREWKMDLIEQVETRRNAAPIPAPAPDNWNSVMAEHDAYRHVYVRGVFLHDRETLVQASTSEGSGFWVMTPLQSDQGFIVLVNRGFVPPERRDPATRAQGQTAGNVTVTGLLRITEPKGSFLRANDAAQDRWYSRDVAAIAAAKNITLAAPYFIDADSTPSPGGWPLGGLTVVTFPNNHLIYALTWFGLALLVIVMAATSLRDQYRSDQHHKKK